MPVLETLALASSLAIVVNRIVEWWPKKALVYFWPAAPTDIVVPLIAVGVSFVVVWWTDINLLPVIQKIVVGKVITVILCAGGASLIADIFGPVKEPSAVRPALG